MGLVHNYMNYEPYTNTWAAKWYLQPVCNTMQYIWATAVILKYFQTGKFLWQAPVGSKVEFDEGSKPGLDWIGMNYYGRYGWCSPLGCLWGTGAPNSSLFSTSDAGQLNTCSIGWGLCVQDCIMIVKLAMYIDRKFMAHPFCSGRFVMQLMWICIG